MRHPRANLAKPAKSDDADLVSRLDATSADHRRIGCHARIGCGGAVHKIDFIRDAHQCFGPYDDFRPETAIKR